MSNTQRQVYEYEVELKFSNPNTKEDRNESL